MKELIEKIESTDDIKEKIRLLKVLKKIVGYHLKNYQKAQ